LAGKTTNFVLLCAVFLFFALAAPRHIWADIKVVGSSTILPIVRDAGKAFYGLTGIRVVAKGGGSRAGIRAALEGTTDIGMVSRSLTSEEAEKLRAHLIGHDGIAVILNSTIPLNKISRQQVVDIYSGAIMNWKALGGKDMEITVIAKKDGRSTSWLFDRFFALEKIVSTAHFIGSNVEAIILVAGDPTAVGYVSIGSAEHAVDLGLKLKLLAMDGVEATSKNVASKKYPLLRPLNLTTLGKPGEDARRFIEFLRSNEGQGLVEKNHFVMINEEGTVK
jgi:phosphate transport system substrate-binding protein